MPNIDLAITIYSQNPGFAANPRRNRLGGGQSAAREIRQVSSVQPTLCVLVLIGPDSVIRFQSPARTETWRHRIAARRESARVCLHRGHGGHLQWNRANLPARRGAPPTRGGQRACGAEKRARHSDRGNCRPKRKTRRGRCPVYR